MNPLHRTPLAVTITIALLTIASCTSDGMRPGANEAAATRANGEDVLGPKPIPSATADVVPESPVTFRGPGGMQVMLVARHTLPLVAVSVVVPFGSASEPSDLPGLAHVAAEMIDRGAGQLDAAMFSQALDDLGAKITSVADRDTTTVTLECLASRLPQALPLLVAALAQPRHGQQDFDQVRSLWMDDLRQRQDDPNEVARLVATAAFYGASSAYGHPLEGTLAAADRITMDRVDRWHRAIWRPDAATVVVVGDVERSQIADLLTTAAAMWRAPDEPMPSMVAPVATGGPRARTVVVERSDAPQVVAWLVRGGVSARDPARFGLDVLNVALGGSFTSRLNQSLREDHGWTYGARSDFALRRGTGMFLAKAAFRADAITEALREMRAVIGEVASHGITDAELRKSRAQFQGSLVESYGTIAGVAARLARGAGIGLDSKVDAEELVAHRVATVEGLALLAREHMTIDAAVVVLVGPKEPILKAIAENQLPPPEFCDGEAVGLEDAIDPAAK